MSVARSYLDHNATAPMRPEVVAACLDAFRVGNPSSVHDEGRRARSRIDAARAKVAALVGAQANEVTFTSGGTEANNTALRPGALRTRDGQSVRRLLVGATEHPSVLSGHGFAETDVELLPVDRSGLVDLADLRTRLRSGAPALVSIQLANSETGILQPLRVICDIAAEAGAVVHADAVQAAGRIPVDMGALGLDALTLSAHKLGGPMGIGALVVRSGLGGPGPAFVTGGGQERGRRGGTENVPGCVGFGVAAVIAARDLSREAPRLRALRDDAESGVRRLAPEAIVFGEGAERLSNTLSFAVPGVRAETALIALDLAGVALSSGSACSSGKVDRSHVLAAMGVADDLARGALRVSLGWDTRADDVRGFLEAFEIMLQRLYQPDRARAA
ncbi:cysteine desulfurase family protein [uncultured Enterovirga sp.]|uniref:cysteine desulfurase family protein n=1 Tax=uncultured Enterovirga sp. TaxID=2026352 RepID=UPI0035CC3ACB